MYILKIIIIHYTISKAYIVLMNTTTNHFDAIIIGGSYSGLSAAMALGRSLRKVLIINAEQPCNRQAPYSHNFLTHDGEVPSNISAKAREQVLQYETVKYIRDKVDSAKKVDNYFEVVTESMEKYTASKLLFSSGIKDIMPPIPGFDECWGRSALHCTYCHGYEVHSKPLGVLANGVEAFELFKLLSQWSKNLVVFTNGPSTIMSELREKIKRHGGSLVEKEIARVEHDGGFMKHLVFTDGTEHPLTALFVRPRFEQNSTIPQSLGCALTGPGFIQVDSFQKTSVPGVFASGDCTTMLRAVSIAVASGNVAGAMINTELTNDSFRS